MIEQKSAGSRVTVGTSPYHSLWERQPCPGVNERNCLISPIIPKWKTGYLIIRCVARRDFKTGPTVVSPMFHRYNWRKTAITLIDPLRGGFECKRLFSSTEPAWLGACVRTLAAGVRRRDSIVWPDEQLPSSRRN